MKEKRTFDAVAFMRKRREELSRDYGGLSAEHIEEQVQQSPKREPLRTKGPQEQTPSPARKITGGCHLSGQVRQEFSFLTSNRISEHRQYP